MVQKVDLADLGRVAQAQFEKDSKALETNLEKAMFLGATKMKADAQRLSPVDSGQLRNSIGLKNTSTNTHLSFQIGSTVPYLKFVHDGTGIYSRGGRKTPWVYFNKRQNRFVWTKGQMANPFLEKAFNDNKEQIIRLVQNAIRGNL